MDVGTLKRKLAMGSLAGSARVALAVPLYLLLTPYMLHVLGAELFGLWSFGTLIISVMSLTDFGFKNALVFHVARSAGCGEEINRHFNVAFWVYLAMAMVVVAVTALLGPYIVTHVLEIPQRLAAEASFVLWITALSFGIRFVAVPYQAVAEGNQEHALSQTILLAWLIVYFLGTLLALFLYPGLYALGAVSVIANLVVLFAFFWRIRTGYPYIHLGVRHLKRDAFVSMMKYGSGIQLATLMIAAREPLLKVMISRAYDLAAVATFEIVYKLCTQLVSIVATPLLGAFSASALLSQQRESDLQNILRPMYGFCLALFVPSVLFLGTFSSTLVEYWLGPEYSDAGAVLPVAFAAFAIYYMSEPLYKALEGSGMSTYSAIIQTLSAALTFSTFSLLSTYRDYAAPFALVAGFSLFSVTNYLVFRWRFRSISLLSMSQLPWLIVPSLIYCLLYRVIPGVVSPVFYFLYFVIHVWCMRAAGIFDLIGVSRRMAGVVRVGMR